MGKYDFKHPLKKYILDTPLVWYNLGRLLYPTRSWLALD